MKVELDLNTNEYIKLNKELEKLYSKYEELDIEYKELENIVNTIEEELFNINNKIENNNNKISKMNKNTSVNTKTICVITVDGTALTILVFTGLSLNFKEPIFALYGSLFYMGEILATNKIIQKIEAKRNNKVVNSEEYIQTTKEIELLIKLSKEKKEELNSIKSKKEEKEEELNNINEEIENKNNEIELLTNKVYMEIDNILESSIKGLKPKTRVKNINENK